MSLRSDAAAAGLPKSTYYDRARRLKENRQEELNVTLGKPSSDPDQLLRQVARWRDTVQGLRTQVHSASIAIPTDRPVALAFTGDWHFGSVGTDYDLLYSDLRKLEKAAPMGVYVVGMGDYGDNYKSNMGAAGSGLYDAVVASPDDQQRGWERLLQRLHPNLLALILGCHLDWDFQKAGRDVLQPICEKFGPNSLGQNVINFGYGGLLSIRVGKTTYRVLARHRVAVGDTGPNPSNAQRRMQSDYPINADWDIVALAHKHYNDLAQPTIKGKEQVWLRSGSYKVLDRYGQKLFGYEGEPGIPMVILWPETRKMVAFRGDHMDDALAFLAMVRD